MYVVETTGWCCASSPVRHRCSLLSLTETQHPCLPLPDIGLRLLLSLVVLVGAPFPLPAFLFMAWGGGMYLLSHLSSLVGGQRGDGRSLGPGRAQPLRVRR